MNHFRTRCAASENRQGIPGGLHCPVGSWLAKGYHLLLDELDEEFALDAANANATAVDELLLMLLRLLFPYLFP